MNSGGDEFQEYRAYGRKFYVEEMRYHPAKRSIYSLSTIDFLRIYVIQMGQLINVTLAQKQTARILANFSRKSFSHYITQSRQLLTVALAE